MLTQATRFLSLMALSAVMLGCGDSVNNPATTEVTGTVTYKGNPVEGAIVKLWPLEAGKKGASGFTDAQGKYSLMTFVAGDGAMPGEYQVSVVKYPPGAEPDAGSYVGEEGEEIDDEGYDGETDEAEAKNELPKMYEQGSTSGLTISVGTEPMDYPIDVK